jgi:hypothetical protein
LVGGCAPGAVPSRTQRLEKACELQFSGMIDVERVTRCFLVTSLKSKSETLSLWVQCACTTLVALGAAYASYRHGRDFALRFGADAATAAIWPLISPRWPQANCYAERFVLRARTELTDRMLILSERHLRAALAEYIRHYNGRRPRRSRGLRPPRPTHPAANLNSHPIKRQQVLGGLINEYE